MRIQNGKIALRKLHKDPYVRYEEKMHAKYAKEVEGLMGKFNIKERKGAVL